MQVNGKFDLVSEFEPAGDQPDAIERLVSGARRRGIQTLLGVTGSGKTFTIANVIARTGKSTLIISHNKTLAAQLYSELKQFFPGNNVGYFVSYYDYYQPESYIAHTDTYIEKATAINEKIEEMRLEATAMLLSGAPTIIVATVSCIYSLGNPADWAELTATMTTGERVRREEIIERLVTARYERNDYELVSGRFRVRGGTIDVIPAYSQDLIRISMEGNSIQRIKVFEQPALREKCSLPSIRIFPAKHYLVTDEARERALSSIRAELDSRLPDLAELERQRLEKRTTYDIEMIQEVGYCSGIENYSRHFDGRRPGEKAFCLMDYFDDDFLLVVDESHVTLPQLHGMYKGDRSRKKELITYGFRLPSAYDNRPLKFDEFEAYTKNTIFVSATPAAYERENSHQIVEQLVRPTGLLDPTVEIKPTERQMDDLISEIQERVKRDERVLVTALTKRMAEDLAEYLARNAVKVRYMHSDIENLRRTEILRQLRIGQFDVLVGINLLREGLDIPEVSLVAILDADKEGFLRNATSLIQTFGRASRNSRGHVILYADSTTASMNQAIQETERRRSKQIIYNATHGITPRTIAKPIPEEIGMDDDIKHRTSHDLTKEIRRLESLMKRHAERMEFEEAAGCRDRIHRIQKELGKKDGR